MSLDLKNIGLSLNGKQLVMPFSLSIAAGEIVTLMGPSGSGKSSLLSWIAGDLSSPLQGHGDVVLNGVTLNQMRPERRRVGRLFQDDLLFPHMSVGENLLFAIAHGARAARDKMMRDALVDAELEGFEHRPPHTLSGGQRSRVSLMRALLAKPDAMLLDEPFSKLDQELRQTMRDYVYAHLRARNIPTLLVTHDRDDAPEDGRILQISKSGDVLDV